jgi:MFS family permease
MGIGCFITIIASFVQAFAPYHGIGVFIFGRVLIGIGQGIALSESQSTIGYYLVLTSSLQLLDPSTSEKLHLLRYENSLSSSYLYFSEEIKAEVIVTSN